MNMDATPIPDKFLDKTAEYCDRMGADRHHVLVWMLSSIEHEFPETMAAALASLPAEPEPILASVEREPFPSARVRRGLVNVAIAALVMATVAMLGVVLMVTV
jgi:hypothetical protein